MKSDRPLCFVLMPFGVKHDPSGGPDIPFDTIYETAIRPGIEGAGMQPIRADEERTGGIIHRAMFERLLLCDFAVADLTTANANVFYELGVRHATRPATTLAIFAERQPLPFDVQHLRCQPYTLSRNNRMTKRMAEKNAAALTERLKELRELVRTGSATDSPLFQLLAEYRAPDIAHLKTDTFREQVSYSSAIKERLADARRASDADAIERVEQELGSLDAAEAGVLVDLFLSYRAVSRWDLMVRLYDRLPAALRRSVLVREQLAFALNRSGDRSRALQILEEVRKEQGPSSETCGLIGRIFKDRWVEAREAGKKSRARGFLDRAIDAYVEGFEADWRDAYPGINAVTLLDVKGDEKALALEAELLPVVRFSVRQRLRAAKPDYWDHATLLELAVLAGDRAQAEDALADALAAVRESWEPATTANNLRLIHEARRRRGVSKKWLATIISELET